MTFGKELRNAALRHSPFLLKTGVQHSIGAFFAEIENLFKGEDCYILACGPSLNDYKKEELLDKLKNKLVFCVKQSVEEFSDICDVHFYNCSNLPLEGYQSSDDYLTLASSNYRIGYKIKHNDNMDIFIKVPLIEEIGGRHRTLAHLCNFNDFLFSKTLDRTVGPGIMLETVLHFAVHLGVKSITTLGWDLDSHGSYFHNSDVKSKGCEIPWDIEQNLKATKDIFYWLKDSGVPLRTSSKNNNLYEKIERIDL